MNVYLLWVTNSPDACHFCDERETQARIYVECIILQPLLLRFWLHFSPHFLIYAHLSLQEDEAGYRGHSVTGWGLFPVPQSITSLAELLWGVYTDSLDAFEEQQVLSGVLCLVFPSDSLIFQPLTSLL